MEQSPATAINNRRTRRPLSFQILLVAVLAFILSKTATHAFVHPFSRPVGGHCTATTGLRSRSPVTATAPRDTRLKMSTSDSSSDRCVTRADAIGRVGSAVLKGALAAFVSGGAVGHPSFAQDEEADQFEALKKGLDLKKKQEQLKENLPLLTSAAGGLKTLNSFIEQKDYTSIRQALRTPPISNLRSSSKKIIANLSDEGVKAKTQEAYQALISSVEELDRAARDGVKGSLTDDKGIMAAYDKCVLRGETLIGCLPANFE